MLFGDDQLFTLARSAKLRQLTLPPILEQLREWIHAQFATQVVYIALDQIKISPTQTRPRLRIILETDADYNAWKKDLFTIRPDISSRVLLHFKQHADSSLEPLSTDNLFLALDNFSDECLSRACKAFLKAEADQVVQEFADVPIWKIDGLSRHLVVFLRTDKEIEQHQKSGVCTAITKRCFQDVKQHDEFGYLSEVTFRLTFDSKENLDNNYCGSMFYYWR